MTSNIGAEFFDSNIDFSQISEKSKSVKLKIMKTVKSILSSRVFK